jgi:hypothetical protein
VNGLSHATLSVQGRHCLSWKDMDTAEIKAAFEDSGPFVG